MDITYDEWFDKYKPRLDENGDVVMYETYSPYIDPIMDIPENYIWTWVDGGDYSGYSAGFHKVNRMGYFVTEVPWESEDVYVDIYEMTLCDMGNHIWVDHERYDGTEIIICSECEVDKSEYDEDND